MRQTHGKNKTTKRNTATATTRKSPGQICVSPAEKTAKQHKTGPEPHQKKTTPNHGDCLRHDRDKPTESPKYVQKELTVKKQNY
jgi:hypothetical protein